MGLLDFFRARRSKGTASIAKGRLQILVAHDRATRTNQSSLAPLQRAIPAIIRK